MSILLWKATPFVQKATYAIMKNTKDMKISCKGASKCYMKLRPDPIAEYKKVLEEKGTSYAVNKGFRAVPDGICTYTQHKAAFSYLYVKRKIVELYFISPLNVTLNPAATHSITYIQQDTPVLS